MKKLLRLAVEAKGHRAYLIIAGACTLLLTGLSLIAPRIQTIIITYIEDGLSQEDLRRVVTLSLLLLGIYLIRAFFRWLGNMLAHKAAWNIVQNIRIKLYDKIQTFTNQYFSTAKTGDLMSVWLTTRQTSSSYMPI
jgi:ABC-type multidrug transport system fused ATPase/permease subunit